LHDQQWAVSLFIPTNRDIFKRFGTLFASIA